MRRLKWEFGLDRGLWAFPDGSAWSFYIEYDHDQKAWMLETTRRVNGPDERSEQRYLYLQDAMAAAELTATVVYWQHKGIGD